MDLAYHLLAALMLGCCITERCWGVDRKELHSHSFKDEPWILPTKIFQLLSWNLQEGHVQGVECLIRPTWRVNVQCCTYGADSSCTSSAATGAVEIYMRCWCRRCCRTTANCLLSASICVCRNSWQTSPPPKRFNSGWIRSDQDTWWEQGGAPHVKHFLQPDLCLGAPPWEVHSIRKASPISPQNNGGKWWLARGWSALLWKLSFV